MKAVTFFLLMGQAMPCLLEGQWVLQARGPHLEGWALDAVEAAMAFSPCTVWVLLKSPMAVASKFCSGSQGPILSQPAQISPGASCQWVAHVGKRAIHSNHLSILVFCFSDTVRFQGKPLLDSSDHRYHIPIKAEAMGHTLCASFHRLGEDSLEKRNSLIPLGGSMHTCVQPVFLFAIDADRSCTIAVHTGPFVQRAR